MFHVERGIRARGAGCTFGAAVADTDPPPRHLRPVPGTHRPSSTRRQSNPPGSTAAAAAARLRAGAARLGVALDEATAARLVAFAAELLRWNVKIDLIGPADLQTVIDRHLLDSLALLPLLRAVGVTSLADLGSGAGLPGLVLAVAEPALRVVSIEPRARRVAFQRHAVRQLGLANVQVVAARLPDSTGGRAAAIPGTPADAVVGRAVAPLPAFLALALSLIRPGGVVIAMRGPKGADEAEAAAGRAAQLGLTLEAQQEYRLPGDAESAGGAPRTRWLLLYRYRPAPA